MRISPLGQLIAAAALAVSLSVSAFATEQHLQDLRIYCEFDCQPGPDSVPEPGVLGLLGLGLAGIYLAGRRRKP